LADGAFQGGERIFRRGGRDIFEHGLTKLVQFDYSPSRPPTPSHFLTIPIASLLASNYRVAAKTTEAGARGTNEFRFNHPYGKFCKQWRRADSLSRAQDARQTLRRCTSSRRCNSATHDKPPRRLADQPTEADEFRRLALGNILALERVHQRTCLRDEVQRFVMLMPLLEQPLQQLLICQSCDCLISLNGSGEREGNARITARELRMVRAST